MIIFSCYAKVREFISVNGVLKIFNSVHGHMVLIEFYKMLRKPPFYYILFKAPLLHNFIFIRNCVHRHRKKYKIIKLIRYLLHLKNDSIF